MENKKSIDLLNTLVEINSDRIAGYETASIQTEELDLKELFTHLAATSKECRDHLVSEVLRLGGKPAQETGTAGKFFREWGEVKAALTGKDRKIFLTSCEFGEDIAVSTYQSALREHGQDLLPDQISMLTLQLLHLRADRDKVKVLCDRLVEAEE